MEIGKIMSLLNKKEKESSGEFVKRQEELVSKKVEEWQEKKEEEFLTEEEKAIREKLREELEKMELEPELEKEAHQRAKEIEQDNLEEKIRKLFFLAQEKGLVFAVGVAKKMNDPYVLDIFHDLLAKDELYRGYL